MLSTEKFWCGINPQTITVSNANATGQIWANRCGNIVWVHGYHSLNSGVTSGSTIATLPWKPIEAASVPTQNDAAGYQYGGYIDVQASGAIVVGTSWSGYTRYSFCYFTNDYQ